MRAARRMRPAAAGCPPLQPPSPLPPLPLPDTTPTTLLHPQAGAAVVHYIYQPNLEISKHHSRTANSPPQQAGS